MTVEGGKKNEVRFPNSETVPAVQENPTSSHEQYRTAWRRNIADPQMDAYVRSRFPSTLSDVPGFSPNYQFSPETGAFSPFLYDAVTALGLSYCRAAAAAEGGFGGADVFDQFKMMDYPGASGQVQINAATGTRNYTTEVFSLLNVQEHEIDASGNQTFKLVPTSYYQGQWKPVDIAGQVFEYANGGTQAPQSLPSPDLNRNFIGGTGRAVGYTLMGLIVGGAVISMLWLIWFGRERVVRSSQPLFLLMVAFGALVMASSIYPLSLEDNTSEDGLDTACMSAPWLYVSGVVIAFSSLLAKTRGVHKVRGDSVPSQSIYW